MSLRDATMEAHVAQRGTSTVAQRSRAERALVAQPDTRPATFVALGVAIALAGAFSMAGCHSGPGVTDGGQDGGRPVCVGATTCAGTSVRACRDGRPAEVVQECGAESLACSLGRCVSPSCATAESHLTS